MLNSSGYISMKNEQNERHQELSLTRCSSCGFSEGKVAIERTKATTQSPLIQVKHDNPEQFYSNGVLVARHSQTGTSADEPDCEIVGATTFGGSETIEVFVAETSANPPPSPNDQKVPKGIITQGTRAAAAAGAVDAREYCASKKCAKSKKCSSKPPNVNVTRSVVARKDKDTGKTKYYALFLYSVTVTCECK